MADLRKEGGGGDWEGGRREVGGGVVGAGEEEGGRNCLREDLTCTWFSGQFTKARSCDSFVFIHRIIMHF